jgi:hypothetical protein
MTCIPKSDMAESVADTLSETLTTGNTSSDEEASHFLFVFITLDQQS